MQPRARLALAAPLPLTTRLPAALLAAALASACRPEAPPPAPARDGPLRLVDVTAEAGLASFIHAGGRHDKAYLPDTTGSGACAFDYDRDGDDDLYLVNGSDPDGRLAEPPTDRLFRNDSGRFTDVTAAVGLGSPAWGQGCAAGDYDGDGFSDLYVTNLMEPDLLYRNRGDGTFEDATARAGLGDAGWGTSAAFFDLERDGDLDLYVARYVDFGWEPDLAGFPCSWLGLAVACGPQNLRPSPDLLYCNRGDGTFEECSSRVVAGEVAPSYGMGVLAADTDGDGDTDVFVANDTMPNFHFVNEGGRLHERAGELGTAWDAEGKPKAGMGIAWLDGALYVTNFAGETDTLYELAGGGRFRDATRERGLADATLKNLSWGVAAFDPDLDGDLDLLVASGHIYPQVDGAADLGFTYLQRPLFFRNVGERRFRPEPEVLSGVGPLAGRGLAVLDLEGDGDPDVVINNLDGPPTVLRAEGAEGRPFHVPEPAFTGGSYLSTHGRMPRGVRR